MATEHDIDNEPRMFVVVRCDLPEMTWPKAMGQVGHAILMALAECYRRTPDKALAYMLNSTQGKVVLRGRSLAELTKAKAKADELGIPNALVVDAARTCFSRPTPTVLGIGPTTKREANAVVKRFQLLEERHFGRTRE